ncbi:hypothetical protein LBW89_07010 [Paenibacillus sp. alder61]|uniref:hypothetical protein n=1 Tax=Paenibacillus sp. alder61 TaxID=2862948 RepID=UPI001CD3F44A|nr:hypothetical protein [Paenibacillus sp. alder61]MCA1292763.1 hypothetical protein [Paenibacillus sp. alder61]
MSKEGLKHTTHVECCVACVEERFEPLYNLTVESPKVGAPLKKEEIEKAKEKMPNTPPTEGAGPAPASN